METTGIPDSIRATTPDGKLPFRQHSAECLPADTWSEQPTTDYVLFHHHPSPHMSKDMMLVDSVNILKTIITLTNCINRYNSLVPAMAYDQRRLPAFTQRSPNNKSIPHLEYTINSYILNNL